MYCCEKEIISCFYRVSVRCVRRVRAPHFLVLRAGLALNRQYQVAFYPIDERQFSLTRALSTCQLEPINSVYRREMAEERELSTNKKRRGVARASITRLDARISDLESKPDVGEGECDLIILKLDALDAEFRKYHLAIVDLTDDGNALEREQETLDAHDDKVTALHSRIQRLVRSSVSRSPGLNLQRRLVKRMKHLDEDFSLLATGIDASSSETDVCLMKQYEDRLIELKVELSDITREIINLDGDDEDLSSRKRDLRAKILDKDLKLKQLLYHSTTSTPPQARDKGGLKLPKLEVPSFDANFVHWSTFWEQFQISVHEQKSLCNSEKLVYLKHALKDKCKWQDAKLR